jgi:MOSC domain-containing protein YiiM
LGDIFQVGDTLKIQVSQPRLPCDQISMRWNMPDLTKLVKKSGRTGWYMSVLEEGVAEAGMTLKLLECPHPEWTITVGHEIYQKRSRKPEQALALSKCEALETGWRNRLKRAGEKGMA